MNTARGCRHGDRMLEIAISILDDDSQLNLVKMEMAEAAAQIAIAEYLILLVDAVESLARAEKTG